VASDTPGARPAPPADHDDDGRADLQIACVRTGRVDDSSDFMTKGHGPVDHLRECPIEDMEVGVAHPGADDSDPDGIAYGLRHRNVEDV
jgi:hypothetical protein